MNTSCVGVRWRQNGQSMPSFYHAANAGDCWLLDTNPNWVSVAASLHRLNLRQFSIVLQKFWRTSGLQKILHIHAVLCNMIFIH